MNEQVLYVEDDADAQEMVQIWLGLHGYSVSAAPCMADALDLAETRSFSIYILDNWLPDGSGVELCRQIRTVDPHTPILFVSGAAFQSDIEQALAAGAQAYLTKPVDLTDLYSTVARLVKAAADCSEQVGVAG